MESEAVFISLFAFNLFLQTNSRSWRPNDCLFLVSLDYWTIFVRTNRSNLSAKWDVGTDDNRNNGQEQANAITPHCLAVPPFMYNATRANQSVTSQNEASFINNQSASMFLAKIDNDLGSFQFRCYLYLIILFWR